jgi:hypothetical protein
METFLAVLVTFALVMLAMGLGVMVSGRQLRGSCGGIGEACRCDAAARSSCALAKRQADS